MLFFQAKKNLSSQKLIHNLHYNIFFDMPKNWSVQFQDDGTRIFCLMKTFHTELMIFMTFLFILIFWFLVSVNYKFAAVNNLFNSKKVKFNIGNRNPLGLRLRRFSWFHYEKGHYISLMAAKKNISSIWEKTLVYKHENTLLEITWTILPTFLLIAVSIPSLLLIYLMNRPGSPTKHNITLQIISSQWYWSYTHQLTYLLRHDSSPKLDLKLNAEAYSKVLSKKTNYLNYNKKRYWNTSHWVQHLNKIKKAEYIFSPLETWKVSYNTKYWNTLYGSCVLGTESAHTNTVKTVTIKSNLIEKNSLLKKFRNLRLLDVDRRLILPRDIELRCLVTSTDVLHSWAIPSLGIKVDACPGRLNEVRLTIYRNSVFYGQCSEICGIMHGFMPIVIQTVTWLDYLKYILILSSRHTCL